jgi:hypothetical protein
MWRSTTQRLLRLERISLFQPNEWNSAMLSNVALEQILPELASRTHTATDPLLRPAVCGLVLGLPRAIEHQEVERVDKGSDQRQVFRGALAWTPLQRRDELVRRTVTVLDDIV